MSKAKTPRGKGKPRKHIAEALAVEPFKGSITILTQDPNVNGGVMVPPDGYAIATPGAVIICGPLVLPGQDLEIQAETIGTQTDTKGQAAAIDTSAPAWNGAPPPPLPPPVSGSNGATGATGDSGMNGGNTTIQADTYKLTNPLAIRAEGGD